MSKATSKILDAIRELSAKGFSHTEIGKRIEKSRKAVQKLAKRYGIEPFFPQGGPKGERNGSYHGGWTIDKGGYKLVLAPNHPFANYAGYVREHRLVMERYLRRWLLPTEIVHHKNGNKLDNGIENLQLFSKNSDHLKVELTGKCPKWSAEGIKKIKEGASKPRILSAIQLLHRQALGRLQIQKRKRDAKGRLLPKTYVAL